MSTTEARAGGFEGLTHKLPEELQQRETRLKRIGEAKRALEERAREKAKKEGKLVENARPEAKDQYNFTDPESRMMKSSSDGLVQAYNAQIVVEPELRLIVGQAVTQVHHQNQVHAGFAALQGREQMTMPACS